MLGDASIETGGWKLAWKEGILVAEFQDATNDVMNYSTNDITIKKSRASRYQRELVAYSNPSDLLESYLYMFLKNPSTPQL
jgi:hypothetical protein